MACYTEERGISIFHSKVSFSHKRNFNPLSILISEKEWIAYFRCKINNEKFKFLFKDILKVNTINVVKDAEMCVLFRLSNLKNLHIVLHWENLSILILQVHFLRQYIWHTYYRTLFFCFITLSFILSKIDLSFKHFCRLAQ